ncbi:MAG: nucleotidyltransferase domain-containing protein [Deferribacteraceae bacterium]|jgi:predicted nucleotidyltransferase|nr:nucleotidyltransferase domain-containing protein [Deferribacteraceae bacterium]
MKALIKKNLQNIEMQHNIRIILAVESGSRAWGFSSADSDWDVRFIYVNRPAWYLKVFPDRDVIELMDGELDLSGWDIRKALTLLHRSNPSLFEWLRSPIVYAERPEAAEALRALSSLYYQPKPSIHHYLHMATNNWNAYIKGANPVLMKKYLYIFRPILACQYIEDTGSTPPMEIDKLLGYLSGDVLDNFNKLLAKKRGNEELGKMQPDETLNQWIEERLAYFERYASSLNRPQHTADMLDQYLNTWVYKIWD